MGRSPCCAKEGLNRGAWTAMEDKMLKDYIKLHGEGKWRSLPIKAGLKRCGKSCRLRWLNYLKPDIKRGNISRDEEDLIIRLHNLLGNRWSLIAGRLPGRTDNEIKNYWNTNIGKKMNNTVTATTSSDDNADDCPRPTSSPTPLIRRSNSDHKLSKKKTKKTTVTTTKTPLTIASPRGGGHKLTTTTPAVAVQPMISNVVRTKATRCTRVFIDRCHSPPLVITTQPNIATTSYQQHHHHDHHHHNSQYFSSSSKVAPPPPTYYNNNDDDNKLCTPTTAAAAVADHTNNSLNHHHQLLDHTLIPQPQPTWDPHNNNDLLMDLDMTDDGFLIDTANTITAAAVDDTTFPPFCDLDYPTITQHAGEDSTNDDNNKAMLDHLSSSLDDDQGLFFNEDDDIRLMMQAAVDAGELDTTTNNWLASLLGPDMDIDDFDQQTPLVQETVKPVN